MATKITGKSRGGIKLIVADPFEIPLNQVSQELQAQFDVLLDDKTKLEISNLFAKTVNPWVPFLEGPLSQTLNVTTNYIEYLMPYAARQYYGDGFNFTKDKHPLATAHWDEVAMQTQLNSFVSQVEDILRRRAAELYG